MEASEARLGMFCASQYSKLLFPAGAVLAAGVAWSTFSARHHPLTLAQEASPVKKHAKQIHPIHSLKDKSLPVDLNGFKRIDHILDSTTSEHIAKNAVHGTLRGDSMIEVYDIYFNKEKGELLCLIHFGTALNGHPEVVHGGITATLFDNSFGWLFLALRLPVAFTASLNVNYRNKVPEDSTVILRASVNKQEGRKMHFVATMHDLNGKLLADSTSLFISPKNKTNFPISISESSEKDEDKCEEISSTHSESKLSINEDQSK